MAYATASDMVARFDARTLCQLCSDNDTPIPEAMLSDNVRMVAALAGGAGEINSSVMIGDLYTADQLAELTGDDLAYLVQLNCDLALGRLFGARPLKFADETVERVMQSAREAIEMLRQGHRLFNIQEKKTAGLISVDGPTVVDLQNNNGITERTHNFYPHSGSRLPLGRGGS